MIRVDWSLTRDTSWPDDTFTCSSPVLATTCWPHAGQQCVSLRAYSSRIHGAALLPPIQTDRYAALATAPS